MNTYIQDKEFLAAHFPLVELRSDRARLLCSAALQGRVLTTSLDGDQGASLGFVNYPLIRSGQTLPHCNNWGGEERFWLGPEGGQYALFFAPGAPYDFDHWQTPAVIDTEEWQLVAHDERTARFATRATLVNHHGTRLHVGLDRTIEMQFEQSGAVAYETTNTLTNLGTEAWNEQTGMPSIWMLGQFNPGERTRIIIPLKAGGRGEVNQTYFGRIGDERLSIREDCLVFTADGRRRGKLGLPPTLSTGRAAAYDPDAGVLTVLSFKQPLGERPYVNAMWEHQEHPYRGDAINAYNDGPLDDGSIMGPFFELESSSPAARLLPGESLTHRQRTAHYRRSLAELDAIARLELGLSLSKTLDL